MNAAAAVLVTLILAPAAAPAAGQTLNGLFCNTEAQIDAAVQLMDGGTPAEMALAALNRQAQVCTLADRIGYVVEAPTPLGRTTPGNLFKFRARLVAVAVGGTLRPVEPPATIFFVQETPLTGAGEQT